MAVFAAKLKKQISGRFSVEADDRVEPAAGTYVGAGAERPAIRRAVYGPVAGDERDVKTNCWLVGSSTSFQPLLMVVGIGWDGI